MFRWSSLSVLGLLACSTEQPLAEAEELSTPDGNERGESARARALDGGKATDEAPDASGSDTDPRCEPTLYEDQTEQYMGTMSANVIDQDGANVPDLSATVCGRGLCLFAFTHQSGDVLVNADRDMTISAFKYGQGIDFAEIAQRLPDAEGRPRHGTMAAGGSSAVLGSAKTGPSSLPTPTAVYR